MKQRKGTWRKHPDSQYPANWERIARRAKQRAGWRCERCGHPQRPDGRQLPCDERCTHDPRVCDHRVLTVHHLDGDRGNSAWWNLAALCQRCHLSIQSTIDFDQAMLFPEQFGDWFIDHLQGYLRAKRKQELTAAT